MLKNHQVIVLSISIFLLTAFFHQFQGSRVFAEPADPNVIIPISQVRENDSNGVPNLLDQVVTISGEVTATTQFGIQAAIQDETGGVVIYDAGFANAVEIGDLVTVTGTVDQYNGLTELANVTIDEHTPGSPTIEPEFITCRNISNEGSGGIEGYEGNLVRLNNVTVNTAYWSVSGSGANFTLSDASGSCEIRIDADCNISNTPAPGSEFDVIGIVTQFDYSSPYTNGYQLLPRFIEDIISEAGPRLTSRPVESEMTSSSFRISWKTQKPSNSIVRYGITTEYELDSMVVDEAVTEHSVMISGLSPATVYHVQVGSADENGTNYSADHLVITASHPSSTGEMNVYFTKSVNKNLADGMNTADGSVDLEQKLIERIQAAKYSIDLCFYSWNLEGVTDALIDAYYRRIQIRFIYDATHDQYQVYRLSEEGIPIIDDSFGNNDASGKIQHNKFAIFDARNNTRYDDDWVWTGSLNPIQADEGVGIDAAQNVIEIQDQALAKAYMMEFNEMWGSDSNSPDAEKSRFGTRKTDNTPHRFIINETPVELYFCPSDNATARIIDAIKTADSSIYFSILAFTRVDVKLAMLDKFRNVPGFDIRGVFDDGADSYSQYFSMYGEGDYAWDPPADVWLDGEPEVLHHKYMLIDSESPDSNPTTITGSQNWSSAAENENDENTLIIHDASITNQYLQEFAERYTAAGGTGAFETAVGAESKPPAPAVFSLHQNYPNPFNMDTQISFSIDTPGDVSLKVYDMTGRLVATLIDKHLNVREYRINFSPDKLSSGVYVYKLKSNDRSLIKKLVLLK